LRFSDQYRCVVQDVRAGDFTCAVEVNKLPCESVTAAADNFDLWLQASADCARILVHADGTAVSDGRVDAAADAATGPATDAETEVGGDP
jgi:hypothetical protein